MTLYEIDQKLLACVDEETGECIDPEQLESLVMEREQKIESVCLWVKNLTAENEAIDGEVENFKKRKSANENKIERLKAWISEATECQKFSTARCAVSFRNSTSTKITDESSIPQQYLITKTEVKADKTAIKKALLAGEQIDGAELEHKLSVTIK